MSFKYGKVKIFLAAEMIIYSGDIAICFCGNVANGCAGKAFLTEKLLCGVQKPSFNILIYGIYRVF